MFARICKKKNKKKRWSENELLFLGRKKKLNSMTQITLAGINPWSCRTNAVFSLSARWFFCAFGEKKMKWEKKYKKNTQSIFVTNSHSLLLLHHAMAHCCHIVSSNWKNYGAPREYMCVCEREKENER